MVVIRRMDRAIALAGEPNGAGGETRLLGGGSSCSAPDVDARSRGSRGPLGVGPDRTDGSESCADA